MQTYSKYKDSEIEWIGKIPEHWELDRLKWYAILEYGKSLSSNDRIFGDIPVFGSNGVVGFHNKAITESPCIIIGRKGSFGKINWSDDKCFPIDTTYYIDDTKTKSNLKWLFYLIRNLGLDQFSQDIGVPGLNRNDVYQKFLPLPSKSEQTAIANFLDRKTAAIDKLIENKKKLIELYEDQKQAFINQAVTKGLDPNVPMKDSGIEWLGEIPEHWEVTRLQYLSIINTGDKDTENRQDDGDYPFFVRSQKIEKISSYSFDGEAVLTAGDGVGVGKVFHYINGKFDYHQRVYKVSDFVKVIGKFIYYYMKSFFYDEVIRISAKSTVESLRLHMLQNFNITYGSIDEQTDIVNYIESKCRKNDRIIDKLQKQIELYQEYRTALISEVVTGKVKVLEVD